MGRILHGNGGIRFLTEAIGEDRERLSSLGRVCMAVLPVGRVPQMSGRTIRDAGALPRL